MSYIYVRRTILMYPNGAPFAVVACPFDPLIRVFKNRLGKVIAQFCADGSLVPDSYWDGHVAIYANGLDPQLIFSRGRLP